MKTTKIVYWITTSLLSAFFLFSSFMYLGQNPELMNSFKLLGFPVIFVQMLGLAKLLGAIALINPWLPKLREWAYAGFSFVLICAIWLHVATHTPFVMPLVFAVLMGVSYYFHERLQKSKAQAGTVTVA